MREVVRYTVKGEEGYYPDGTYRGRGVWINCRAYRLEDARLWAGHKWAQTYQKKFGGTVIKVRVTYEEVPL